GGGTAGGRSSRIDTVAIGAATMKMISSTSMMSTNGVTLMSAFCSMVWPLPPPGPESLAAIRWVLHQARRNRRRATLKASDRVLASPARLVKRVQAEVGSLE